MSVKIQVTDSSGRANAKAKVFVKWVVGGISNAETNSSGIADLKCSGGTIEYITVWDEQVLGKMVVGNDQIVEVTSDKH